MLPGRSFFVKSWAKVELIVIPPFRFCQLCMVYLDGPIIHSFSHSFIHKYLLNAQALSR